MEWLTLCPRSSEEDFFEWEHKWDDIFEHYNYVKEKKVELASSTLKGILIEQWEHAKSKGEPN